MARTVNEAEYVARRGEILDTAYQLVLSKGFDHMSIQDILDQLQISKGAFYHYFGSKGEVLEALVERIVDELEPALVSIVEDPHRSALQKLHAYFDTANRWKSARKSLVLSLLNVWYADENAIVRQKVFTSTMKRMSPWITKIICQGIDEEVFETRYPEYACQINIYLLQGLSDTFVALLLSDEGDSSRLSQAGQILAAYNNALERVLGAPDGSIKLMERELLQEWFD